MRYYADKNDAVMKADTKPRCNRPYSSSTLHAKLATPGHVSTYRRRKGEERLALGLACEARHLPHGELDVHPVGVCGRCTLQNPEQQPHLNLESN